MIAAEPVDAARWSERTIIAAGHAVAGQLDHRATASGPVRPARLTVEAGPRRAEPHAGSRSANEAVRAARRATSAASPGGSWSDVFNIPMTAHFLGGCADRRLDRRPGVIDPYHRRLRPPRPARRRRLGGVGQPRRQPVADHHRPGRAGDGVVAQQAATTTARPPLGERYRRVGLRRAERSGGAGRRGGGAAMDRRRVPGVVQRPAAAPGRTLTARGTGCAGAPGRRAMGCSRSAGCCRDPSRAGQGWSSHSAG